MKSLLIISIITISLFSYSQTWTTISEDDGLVSNTVTAICIDTNNNKWIGTGSGISVFNDTSWTTYDTTNGLVGNHITCIEVDTYNRIWVGTRSGLSMFNGKNWINYTTDNGLSSNLITSIAIEENYGFVSGVWVGTYNGGILKFNTQSWKNYTTSDGLISNNIYALRLDKNDSLWVSYEFSYAVQKHKYNLWETCNIDITDGTISTIEVDKYNNKWFGAIEGFTKYNSDTSEAFCFYYLPIKQKGPYTNAIAFDDNNNKWIGFERGILKYDDTTWTQYTELDGLVKNSVSSLAFDKNGVLWIGTSNGISTFDNSYSLPDTIISSNIGAVIDTVQLYSDQLCSINQSIPVDTFYITNQITKNDSILFHWKIIQNGITFDVTSSTSITNIKEGNLLFNFNTSCSSNKEIKKVTFVTDYSFLISGLESNIIANSFKISPNPCNDLTLISFPCSDNYSIAIFNLNGSRVRDFKNIYNNSITIDCSNIKPGIYIVKILNTNSNQKITKKLIVK